MLQAIFLSSFRRFDQGKRVPPVGLTEPPVVARNYARSDTEAVERQPLARDDAPQSERRFQTSLSTRVCADARTPMSAADADWPTVGLALVLPQSPAEDTLASLKAVLNGRGDELL